MSGVAFLDRHHKQRVELDPDRRLARVENTQSVTNATSKLRAVTMMTLRPRFMIRRRWVRCLWETRGHAERVRRPASQRR
jgi:hypothetical protein